ncbi:MAG: DUF971 domain-containing protein [Phycisphaerae bacterium]
MADHSKEQITPSELKVRRAEQELRIRWRDGKESVFAAFMLRKQCPCATCRQEREKQSRTLLPVLKQAPPTELKLTNAQLVGNYAIQLFWSDGHSTGIYDFKYLRGLDDLSQTEAK